MSELIHLKELDTFQIESIYEQFQENFANETEFKEFMKMMVRYNPHGIKYEDFVNSIANFSLHNIMNNLRNKLGEGAIKEHMTDDGNIFYSLGDVPNIKELNNENW